MGNYRTVPENLYYFASVCTSFIHKPFRFKIGRNALVKTYKGGDLAGLRDASKATESTHNKKWFRYYQIQVQCFFLIYGLLLNLQRHPPEREHLV